MAVVPRSERQVSPQGLPSARRTGAPTREELGAGIGEIAANLGVRVVARQQQIEERQAEEARSRANELAVLDARRQLDEFSNQAATDALQTEGADAFELPESVRGAYDKRASEIAEGLTNDDQRVAFERIRVSGRDNLDGIVQRHTAGQIQKWDDDTTQGVLEQAQAAAVANAQDPRRVGLEIGTIVQTVRDYGKRNGVAPEKTEARIDALVSQTHTAVIERMIDGGEDRKASVYYQETKGQISGAQQGKIEKALEEGSLRGESQRLADEITAAGGTEAEQLEKVRAIKDPKLRDATRDRIEHEQAVADRLRREKHEATLVNAGNILDKTPNVRAIPPTDWATFSTGEKQALMNYVEKKLDPAGVRTDRGVYYELATQSADDPEGFAKRNLWTLRHKLGDTEWKQVIGWQRDAKEGKHNEETTGIRTNLQVAQGALRRVGIDPSPDEKDTAAQAAVDRFYEELDKRVVTFKTETGKKTIGTKDLQQIADDLLTEVVTEKGVGVWGALWGQGPVSDVKKRRFEVDPTGGGQPRPVDQVQVPAADRAIIIRKLTERSREPSEAAIRAYYLEAQRRAAGTQGSRSR